MQHAKLTGSTGNNSLMKAKVIAWQPPSPLHGSKP